MDWLEKAQCRGVDSEVFFINQTDGDYAKDKVAEALKFCTVCLVREECLNYALDNTIQYGIYGGVVPKQRRALKRLRRQGAIK